MGSDSEDEDEGNGGMKFGFGKVDSEAAVAEMMRRDHVKPPPAGADEEIRFTNAGDEKAGKILRHSATSAGNSPLPGWRQTANRTPL